ncbi:MAG: hypothetical protein KF696_03690 [Planctomycetes bacterium]|nr:hypothetical protein [Planctomycetota bacterium]MCW8134072.1 hypothetical protein [Planctomycetota bacterium]
MKRAMILAAFLAFGLPLAAQEMPEGEKPAEKPKQEKKEDSKEEARPERPRPERPNRMQRGQVTELARVLREHDTDQDGKLDKAELGNDELFKKLDKDEDGFLTVQEMMADRDAVIAATKAKAKAVYTEEFKILDRDDNGKLSKEELGEKFGTLLKDGDTDKDELLNLDEFVAAREKAAASAQPDRGPGDRGPGERMPGNRGGIDEMLKQWDKDGDGKISKEEAPERLRGQFDNLDKDKDGFLTKEEVEAGRQGAQRPQRERPGRTPEGEKKPEGEEKKPEREKESGGKKEDEF